MAKKTFALEMNGIEIKTLEDLRENFNLEKAVEYFKSGKLVDWLADRFYDDEADAIENISADDKNLSQKICAALDVECDEDLEFTQRVREKKKILAEKTDDEILSTMRRPPRSIKTTSQICCIWIIRRFFFTAKILPCRFALKIKNISACFRLRKLKLKPIRRKNSTRKIFLLKIVSCLMKNQKLMN